MPSRWVAAAGDLLSTFFMSTAENCPFLTLMGLPFQRRDEEVGIGAEEAGICIRRHFGDVFALIGKCTSVKTARELGADFFEDRPSTESPAPRLCAGFIGWLCRNCFVDEASAGALEHVARNSARLERMARLSSCRPAK